MNGSRSVDTSACQHLQIILGHGPVCYACTDYEVVVVVGLQLGMRRGANKRACCLTVAVPYEWLSS